MHHFNYRGSHVTERFDPGLIHMNGGKRVSAIVDGKQYRARTLRGIKCKVTSAIKKGWAARPSRLSHTNN